MKKIKKMGNPELIENYKKTDILQINQLKIIEQELSKRCYLTEEQKNEVKAIYLEKHGNKYQDTTSSILEKSNKEKYLNWKIGKEELIQGAYLNLIVLWYFTYLFIISKLQNGSVYETNIDEFRPDFIRFIYNIIGIFFIAIIPIDTYIKKLKFQIKLYKEVLLAIVISMILYSGFLLIKETSNQDILKRYLRIGAQITKVTKKQITTSSKGGSYTYTVSSLKYKYTIGKDNFEGNIIEKSLSNGYQYLSKYKNGDNVIILVDNHNLSKSLVKTYLIIK